MKYWPSRLTQKSKQIFTIYIFLLFLFLFIIMFHLAPTPQSLLIKMNVIKQSIVLMKALFIFIYLIKFISILVVGILFFSSFHYSHFFFHFPHYSSWVIFFWTECHCIWKQIGCTYDDDARLDIIYCCNNIDNLLTFILLFN